MRQTHPDRTVVERSTASPGSGSQYSQEKPDRDCRLLSAVFSAALFPAPAPFRGQAAGALVAPPASFKEQADGTIDEAQTPAAALHAGADIQQRLDCRAASTNPAVSQQKRPRATLVFSGGIEFARVFKYAFNAG
jgi:hypothetical protein